MYSIQIGIAFLQQPSLTRILEQVLRFTLLRYLCISKISFRQHQC